MDVRKKIKSLIVKRPKVLMAPGEVCFFQTDCEYGRQVEKVTTTSKPGLGLGIGIPISKHFGIGIGKTKVKTKTSREMVWEKEKCSLLLTSNRFLYKIGKNIGQINLDAVRDIKLNKDAITVVSSVGTYYYFMSNKDVKEFMTVWGLIGEAAKQGLTVKDLL